MTEFDITQWSDFVRGIAEPATAEQMQNHLDAGPSPASRTVEALRRVAAVGRSDSDRPIPSSAVRIAKAIGSTARADAAPRIRRVSCLVTFDSLLEPAAAGSRGVQEAHRELTLEAQGYSIDLRLEHEIETPTMVVVGQLLKTDGEDDPTDRSRRQQDQADAVPRPVARAPVFMFSGEHLIGKAVTGHHGEFQIEGSPRRGTSGPPPKASLDLCLLAGEDYLEMPLTPEPGTTVRYEEDAS